MPFKSQAQWKKCWALKADGQAGSWDCKEWADSTKKKYKDLPEEKSAIERLALVNVHLPAVTAVAEPKGIDPSYIFKIAFNIGVHPLAVSDLLAESVDKFEKLAADFFDAPSRESLSLDIPKGNTGSLNRNFNPQSLAAPTRNVKPVPGGGRLPLRRGLAGLMFGIGAGSLGSVLHSNSSAKADGIPINTDASPTSNKVEATPEKGVNLMNSLLGAGAATATAATLYQMLRKKRKEASANSLTDQRLMIIAQALHGKFQKQATLNARNSFMEVLNKCASDLAYAQAPVRQVQFQLASGKNLRESVKIAYPHLPAATRGKIVEYIFKQAMIVAGEPKKEPKIVTERKALANKDEAKAKMKAMAC